jgi:hypothetical protein
LRSVGRPPGRRRIENKELLYTHMQLTDAVTMQNRLTQMEGQRVTASPHAAAPPAIDLEDETVDDEPDRPDDNDTGNVVVAPDGTVMSTEEDGPRPPNQPAARVPDEDLYLDVAPSDDDDAEVPHHPREEHVPVRPPVPIVAVPDMNASSASEPEPVAVPSSPSTRPEPSVFAASTEVPVPEDDTERQNLLRQLDLLRLKFKQSVIPQDIETQPTPAVRCIIERNLVNLKRARNIAMPGAADTDDGACPRSRPRTSSVSPPYSSY